MIRDELKAAQIAAMKGGDKQRLAAIRLMLARIKDRDIELRGKDAGDDDAMVIDVLQKMVKQRRESIQMFDDGGRAELAAAERSELAVIAQFLPRQMDEAATRAAIAQVKADVNASGLKDMGKVMAELKSRHATELDMSKASALVKESLS